MKPPTNHSPSDCSSRRQEARLNAEFRMRNAEFASSVQASSRRLLLRLVLALLSASLGGLPSAQGQTICTSCWYSVTRLRGAFTLTMSGSGTDGCSSCQASGSSPGSFDTGDPNTPTAL